ncbi:MAG: beta strand repeat-containing protein, partial [Actinomycetota bacterium]
VANGATLLVSGGLSGLTDPIFLNGPGVGNNGSLLVQGTNKLSGLVTLSTSSEIGADSGATLTLAGGVSGTNVDVTFDGAGNILASGAISLGTGGVTKQGAGVTTLSSASNAYTGATTITLGELTLSGSGSIPDTSAVSVTGTFNMDSVSDTVGSITGAGTISLGSATLTSGSAGTTSFSGAITGTGNIIKTGSATTLTLSGTNTYSGTTTIAADGGNLTVSGTLGTSSSYAGNVVITSSTSTFTFSNATSGTTQTLSGVISGDGIVAKSGASTLKLSGSSDNTYTGATNVTAGVLSVAKNVALGTTAGITAVSGTGAVHFDGSGLSISEPFTIAASGSGTGALLNLANNNTVTGAVTLSAAATIGSTAGTLTFNVSSDNAFDATSGTPAITFTGAGNITVSDPIDTPISTFTKSGTGVFLTEAVNAYTGSTTISAGTLRLSGSGSIPDSSAVSVTGSGIYDLNSVSDTVGSISSSGSSTSAMTGDACGRTTTGSDFAEP